MVYMKNLVVATIKSLKIIFFCHNSYLKRESIKVCQINPNQQWGCLAHLLALNLDYSFLSINSKFNLKSNFKFLDP